MIFIIAHLIRLGEIHKKFGNKMIVKIVLNQFSSRFIINVDGSKILNKFVVIFSYFFFFENSVNVF